MTEERECEHGPCRCPVPEGEKYCCKGCEERSEEVKAPAALDMQACNCGHPACLIGERD